MKRIIFLIVFFSACFLNPGFISAQEIWTLEKCIEHALENNLQIKLSKLNIETNESWLLQSKADLLPSLNVNGSYSYNFGRSIDPTTNTFVNNSIRSSGLGLSTNLPLFAGFQRTNSIQRSHYRCRR